ncbi:chromosome segregation in meiosis protein 3 [Ceratobasidium sp. AG-Ba]|nr:chromosome segregation in meiosis protein 3 [Ceratobasidium sp. AG-Ba]
MDDIWDDDAVEIARPTLKNTISSRSRLLPLDSDDDHAESSSRPSKRARTDKPLFNPDSDDEPETAGALPAEIDALFDGLDDDDFATGLPPQLDTAQLEREAGKRARLEAEKKRLARGETDVLGELVDEGEGNSKTKEKPAKPKRVIPKLDENRLLERDGLRALVRQSKDFKIKGKGHELSDLNRLMQMYQLWAHKMFPKMQFNDTVERVERLCRTKRMHVALSTWRDEFAGVKPQADDNEENEEQNTELEQAPQHPPTSSPARVTLEPGGPPIRQSQAHQEPDDDEEMWRDMMEAMESQKTHAEAKEKEVVVPSTSRKEPEQQLYQYDEEDWAIMEEMEQHMDSDKREGNKSVQKTGCSGNGSSPQLDHDVSSDAPPEPSGPSEDEDDFYAMYEP